MNKSYPLVRLLRERGEQARIKGTKVTGIPHKLPYQRQIERLQAKFEQFDAALKNVEISVDPRASEPDRALVFELISKIDGFDVAIQALGFEWLTADTLSDDDASEDESPQNEGVPAARVLYLTMPTPKAMANLLNKWEEFKRTKGQNPPPNMAPLWNMFGYLRDLREWSEQDRIDPSIAKYVDAMLAGDPNREVAVELSMWYRESTQRRGAVLSTLDNMLAATGGRRLDVVEIPEIRYQAALVQVPAGIARELKAQVGQLAKSADIMTIRPQSVFEYKAENSATPQLRELDSPPAGIPAQCIAAILDGYPIAKHAALDDRLYVQPVEISATQAPVNLRHHGTAMASLVLHGDLHLDGPTLTRKVTVIPVLTGDAATGLETTPQDKLPIGVVYRALRAIVDADKEAHPHLANITLVNHSIGDTMAPFVRRPSPWAAMLDYFSHHHRLLFIISAGNIGTAIPLPYTSLSEFDAATPIEREAAIMLALWHAKWQRGLLSPAESINGLTVGAAHADGSSGDFGANVDPYPRVVMPNLASAVGFGSNKSIKPDLLHDGGRFAAVASANIEGGVSVSPRALADVGQLVASPSITGDMRHVVNMSGTSNAAALTTRAGIRLADALDKAFDGAAPRNHWLNRRTRAVLLKALIAHGCAWGPVGRVLEAAHADLHHSRRRDSISKLIGYGGVQIDRVLSGDEHRITLIADDTIRHDQLHEYRLPIPRAMLQKGELRSIIITLAWTTPVLPASADYRSIALRLVNRQGKTDLWGGVERSNEFQPNSKRSERGTLLHVILSGEKLKRSVTGGEIFVGVQAHAKHRGVYKEMVPYAIAITMQVAQSAKTTGLYTEVAQKVRQPAREVARVGSH